MKKITEKRKIAIVGVGPRGLSSLESLVSQLNKVKSLQQLEILLFEKTKYIGTSPVYDIHQSKSNWINISERITYLEARESMVINGIQIPSFPSFHQWANKDYDSIPKETPDVFPPRGYVGKYLKQRFEALFEPLEKLNIVSLVNQKVDKLELIEGQINLQTSSSDYNSIDEVLLTIGHQPTKPSEQIRKWEAFAKKNQQVQLIVDAYPVREYLNNEDIAPGKTIALRGFGLAMMDVVRAIAEKFGHFESPANPAEKLTYQTDYNLKNLFVPFSLDGLPMSPKPLNAKIDDWFKPTEKELSRFEDILGSKQKQKAAKGEEFLIDAILPMIAKVYLALSQFIGKGTLTIPEVEDIAKAWLKDGDYQHSTILSRDQSAEKTMQEFVRMATGKGEISLDFCIGQVWRHCQPSIYDQLSFNECADEVFAKIIGLDERIKRYSYGPPVESIQQLLALIEAKVMNLSTVNDPNIEFGEKGWILKSDSAILSAEIMIDTVLDSPRLEAVISPLIKNLLANDLIQAVHDDLGVFINENGYVISNKNNETLPIALLGRLAKGTIIGVDAILECFGTRPQQWAVKAAERHMAWMSKKANNIKA